MNNLFAQENNNGIIKYQKITKHDFEEMFKGRGDNPRRAEMLASLPKQSTSGNVLYFSEKYALFEEDLNASTDVDPRLQHVFGRMSFFRPPFPELNKVYYNIQKDEKLHQIDFMTRKFRITNPEENKAWKFVNKMVKIQGYTCTQAELKEDDDIITAWFTSEIPLSIGPGKYSGLPGAILAIEKNGETMFLATSVEIVKPEKSNLKKPKEGKKVSEEEFSKIMDEKIKEWEEQRSKRMENRRMGGRHHR